MIKKKLIKVGRFGDKIKSRLIRYAIMLFGMFVFPIYLFSLKNKRDVDAQPIFIVGAPRTGSTALYQALTNAFNVVYIDNLAAALYKKIPVGIWISNLVYRNRAHGNFIADFGNTQKYGLHAPSECGEFWYRWLPLDSHFVDSGDTSEKTIKEIRREIRLAQKVGGGAFLFKNLNAGQRLRLIYEAFPRARIIYLKRDPRYTADSILRARKKIILEGMNGGVLSQKTTLHCSVWKKKKW